MDDNPDATLEELGPVDYLVIEFPAGQQNFTGEAVDELARLSEAGIIRVLDLLILQQERGRLGRRARDRRDLEDDAIRVVETEIAEILAADDVEMLAEAMEPGSVAGVLVYENRWAAPFASRRATRRRAAHRLRADPDPGHRRIHRGRAGRGRRELTCRSVQHAPHAVA